MQVNVLLVNKAAAGEQSMPLRVAQVPSIWTQQELLQSSHLGGPMEEAVKVMVRPGPSCHDPAQGPKGLWMLWTLPDI